MSDLNRRDVVRVAAGCAFGTVVSATGLADQPEKTDAVLGIAAAKDEELASALRDLSTYMFQEQQTLKLEGDGHSRDLIITSARDQDLRGVQVRVRSAAMQVFRAEAEKDEFTQKGGVYWSFNSKEGTVQFKQPGALVMVVRDQQDNVQFFTLVPDFRC